MRPTVITLEGIDGAGKSTLATDLYEHFTAQQKRVWVSSEPWQNFTIDSDPLIATRQWLTDRQWHCQNLIDYHSDKDLIILDRFDLSTVAYQGYGDGVDVTKIHEMNTVATAGIKVTRRLWLNLPVGVAVDRMRGRGEHVSDDEISRLFRVGNGYAVMSQHEPLKIRTIDATQPPDAVLRDAIALIEEVL